MSSSRTLNILTCECFEYLKYRECFEYFEYCALSIVLEYFEYFECFEFFLSIVSTSNILSILSTSSILGTVSASSVLSIVSTSNTLSTVSASANPASTPSTQRHSSWRTKVAKYQTLLVVCIFKLFWYGNGDGTFVKRNTFMEYQWRKVALQWVLSFPARFLWSWQIWNSKGSERNINSRDAFTHQLLFIKVDGDKWIGSVCKFCS